MALSWVEVVCIVVWVFCHPVDLRNVEMNECKNKKQHQQRTLGARDGPGMCGEKDFSVGWGFLKENIASSISQFLRGGAACFSAGWGEHPCRRLTSEMTRPRLFMKTMVSLERGAAPLYKPWVQRSSPSFE